MLLESINEAKKPAKKRGKSEWEKGDSITTMEIDDSNSISEVKYNKTKRSLQVLFYNKGTGGYKKYEYPDFPPQSWAALRRRDTGKGDIGSYIAKNIVQKRNASDNYIALGAPRGFAGKKK